MAVRLTQTDKAECRSCALAVVRILAGFFGLVESCRAPFAAGLWLVWDMM